MCAYERKAFYVTKHVFEHKHIRRKPTHLKGEVYLIIRNVAVSIAAIIFIISIMPESVIGENEHTLRGTAYIFGSLAYLCELIELTALFSKKHPFRELFMPYVMGVLYIVLSISYFMK